MILQEVAGLDQGFVAAAGIAMVGNARLLDVNLQVPLVVGALEAEGIPDSSVEELDIPEYFGLAADSTLRAAVPIVVVVVVCCRSLPTCFTTLLAPERSLKSRPIGSSMPLLLSF